MQKGFSLIIILVAMLLILGLIGTIYFFISQTNPPTKSTKHSPEINKDQTSTTNSSNKTSSTNPDLGNQQIANNSATIPGWKIYSSDGNYTIQYPITWFDNSIDHLTELASVPLSEYSSEYKLPPRAALWINITKEDLQEADKEEILEAGTNANIITMNQYKKSTGVIYKLTGSFWQGDPKEESHRALLRQIFQTFNFSSQGGAINN
jgi:cytoskeletal protein RodZ